MNPVIVIIGAGGIGVAIARRQGFGKTILLADFSETVLSAAADELRTASYSVETQIVDVSSRPSVEALVQKAHVVCPYSHATRGNIPVTLTVA